MNTVHLALKQAVYQTLAENPLVDIAPTSDGRWRVSCDELALDGSEVGGDQEYQWDDLLVFVRAIAAGIQAYQLAQKEIDELRGQS